MSEEDLTRVIRVAEDVATIKSQMAEVHRLVVGNGSRGLVERVGALELSAAKQVGVVAGASAVVSLVISGIGWMLRRT